MMAGTTHMPLRDGQVLGSRFQRMARLLFPVAHDGLFC